MRHLYRIIGFLIVAVTILLVGDFVVCAKEKRVSAAVSQLGGSMGSIPGWPMGTEYRVTFNRTLSPSEINTLLGLNKLRGRVGVRFVNCHLKAEDRNLLDKKLVACHVFDDTNEK